MRHPTKRRRSSAQNRDRSRSIPGHRNRVLAQLGLTPNDSRALTSLDQETGRTLRSLAEEWQCDASTATWIVDRLEGRGLAERQPHPSDRRARLVVLTPVGARTRAVMFAGTYTPPPELLELDRTDLATLRDAVARLPTARRRVRASADETRVRTRILRRTQ